MINHFNNELQRKLKKADPFDASLFDKYPEEHEDTINLSPHDAEKFKMFTNFP